MGGALGSGGGFRANGVPKALSAAVCVVLLLPVASAAMAQSTVLVHVVDFGRGLAEQEAQTVRQVLAGEGGVEVADPQEAAEQIADRYLIPVGIALEDVVGVVSTGEESYYVNNFTAAIETLSGREFRWTVSKIADMSADPELALWVRRGLMAQARSEFYGLEDADALVETTATIWDSLRVFPTWLPDTSWYQPDFVAFYEAVYLDFLSQAQPLLIVSEDEDCTLFLNGLEVEESPPVRVSIAEGPHAVCVVCDDRTSAIHRVDVTEDREVFISVVADDVISGGRATFEHPSDLAPIGRALGDISGAPWVLLVGYIEGQDGNDVQLVLVDSTGGDIFDATVTDPTELGQVAVELLEGSTTVPEPDSSTSFGAAPWIVAGIGVAGIVVGTIFAVMEDDSFDELDACRDDTFCINTAALEELNDDVSREGTVASVGMIVGAVGVVTAIVLFVLDGGREEGPPQSDENTSVGTVHPHVREGGIGIDLVWRF